MATAVTPPPSVLQPDRQLGTERPAPSRPRRATTQIAFALCLAVVGAGLVARFLAPGGLWLDEALSVNIARLPLSQMPGALVQDGSPPLYYFLLHWWMLVFGQGDFAVRAMSALFSVAALPFIWLAGRRLGGPRAAWAALLLAASSPWAIYYSSYTRMYSLMALEAVLGFLAWRRAMELPSRGRLACVAAVTAALLYTHYWDLYLLGVVGLWVLWRWGSEARRRRVQAGTYPGAARRLAVAMLVGGVTFLPWSPVFVFQVLHTGTPWSAPPGPANLLSVVSSFSGQGAWGKLLGLTLFALIALAVFARPGARATSVVLELWPQPATRFVTLLFGGTLVLAVGVGALTGAAFDQRYIAVVFPLFILLAALGLTTFASPAFYAGVLSVACIAGFFSAQQWDSQPRTEAVKVAAVLNQEAQPGDMVVYCPDQLGPAVDRLLNVPDVTELTYPRLIGPQRVDWVDYVSRIEDTNPATVAQELAAKLSPGARLWLVWRNGYQPFGGSCGSLEMWLAWYLPGGETVVPESRQYYEYENLTVFGS
ncbi:MAG TPA: glycosyltransferase family 39 protein [Acidimicrobiales bacterium]|nr:glycosyltransferase family 39 protein [Acidimicrobiales bacterium]